MVCLRHDRSQTNQSLFGWAGTGLSCGRYSDFAWLGCAGTVVWEDRRVRLDMQGRNCPEKGEQRLLGLAEMGLSCERARGLFAWAVSGLLGGGAQGLFV